MNHGFILIELLTALIIISYCLGTSFNYLFASQQHSKRLYLEYVKHLEQVSTEAMRLQELQTRRRNSP